MFKSYCIPKQKALLDILILFFHWVFDDGCFANCWFEFQLLHYIFLCFLFLWQWHFRTWVFQDVFVFNLCRMNKYFSLASETSKVLSLNSSQRLICLLCLLRLICHIFSHPMSSIDVIWSSSVKVDSRRPGPSLDNRDFDSENFSRSKVQQLLTNCEGKVEKKGS